ncbi:AP-4 complex subunit beta-1, partial [Mortierella sp. NVP85]
SEIVDKLYAMIRDRDTHVVVNAILALEAILVDEGGIVINQNIATHLIQRYKEWNPSQLQVILGILCRYKPQISDDVYEIMNDLDDGIQHSSLAVQMATLRLFIWLCQDVNEVQEELQKTIEETLLKHLESPVPDLVYASLSHLALIVETTGTLCHNTPQHLSALFCRSQDPVPVKLQKLDLCVKIVQSSLSTSAAEGQTRSDLILDHLCRVASMKELAFTQKSGRTKLDRSSMAGPFEVACRAIDAIANVATGVVHQEQHHGQLQGSLLSNPQPRADDKGRATTRNIVKYCLERLFRLLVFFSSMEHVLEKSTDSNSDSWIHTDIADLGLDESQVARLLSTVLTAIESCWQREFDARQRGVKAPGGSGLSGDHSGAFSPFQIKVLGLILLRHLDQGELDRLAKKKKPLRFRYDVEQGDSSLSSSTLGMENSLYEQRQQEPGDMSRLARINGIKMLLLEESAQQLSLQQQLQKLSEVTGTTTTTIDTPSEKEPEAQRADQGKEAKLKALQAALAMRSQYALLLQQQVQDLVQSIDANGFLAGSTRSSNHAYLTTRAEHLAILNLACHLVAFSVETEHGNGESMSEEAVDLLRRRVDILAQAVDQLIPGPGSRVRSGEDLLSLESMTVGEQSNPPPPSELGSHGHPPAGVAKDVADRARLIEALFLVPLSKVLVLSLETALEDAPKPTPRTISQANQFDSPLFKTESYLSTVRQKFVAQYGVRTKDFDPENIDQEPMVLGSMDHTTLHDWLTQVGFNTLAVIRSH